MSVEPLIPPDFAFEEELPESAGPEGRLGWVPLRDLVVDDSYQRPLGARNWAAIRKIGANFSWRKFAALIVSPIGDKFALIDGQHRAYGAALAGASHAPAWIVVATPQEQAAIFKAVNGDVVQMSALNKYHAALAAGEADHVGAAAAAAIAGVTVLRYPVAVSHIKPGQTLAARALVECYRRYGRNTLITALQCVTETSNNVPGALSARLIVGLCTTIGEVPAWREAGERLLSVIDDLDLEGVSEGAVGGNGRSVAMAIADDVRAHLRARLNPLLAGAA